jgi:hypothetical protein
MRSDAGVDELAQRRFARLLAEDALALVPAEVESIEEVAAFADLADRVRRVNGGRLPRAVADPDVFVHRTVELAGENGIPDARLRVVLKFLSAKRMDIALAHLVGAGAIISRLERRADRRGVLRPQRIWFHCRTDAQADGQT